jgi:hypothetical protein
MKLIFTLSVFAVLALSGCATHRDVRPGSDGVNHVVVRSSTKESAEESAIRQAENYCDDVYHNHAAFVNEQATQYTGSMDESTRDTVHKASTAAMVLGGAATVMGDDGVRGAGTVLGGAGTAGSIITGGNDYTADMKFRCQ